MENISKLTPILYEKNETSFNHNGLGKLTKLLVNEIEEVLNSEFEAFFEYPVNAPLADKIDHEMFVKAKPNKKDEPHVFKIYDYEVDTISQTILIYARSKNIEDLRNNMILDVNVKNLAPTQAYNLAKNNALDPVSTTFYSDITTTSSVHWERRSLLSTIAGQEGSMIQYWGGEIKHTNGRVSLFRRRGQDNVTTVRHGKNLEGLKATYSTKGLVTAIVPYYSRNDDKSVYGSVVKSEYVNNYPNIYYDIVEYNDEELGLSREDEPEDGYSDATIRTALNNKAKNWFKENAGKDLPSINMEINLVDISQTKEYAHFKDFEQIEIGDTITVYAKKFNVNVNAKVRRVVYNGLTDMNEVVEVGTVRRSLYDDVRDDFKHDLNRVENELQEGIDHAMTSANGKNTNYHGTADPNEIGLVGQNNDNYFRTNGQFKELWIYRDGMWHLEVGDLTGQQIRTEVEQAQQDITEAQTTADEAVGQIDIAVANAGFTSLSDSLTGIQSIATESMDLANDLSSQVSGFELTVDGFNQVVNDYEGQVAGFRSDVNGLNSTVASYEDELGDYATQVSIFENTVDGLQSTVTNVDGRINTLSSTVDGSLQRISDAEGNLTQIEQNVNGIQQTVSDPVNGLVTQVSTLASGFNVLAKDFEGLEIGGRNLFSYSRRNVVSLGRGTLNFDRSDTPYGFYMVGDRDDLDDIRMYDVLDGNGFYTISFDLRGSQNGIGTSGVNINGSNETRFRTRGDNDWERVSVTFEVTNYDYDNPEDNYIGFDPGWQYIWHRYVKVEKGTVATDWTPAPEDMATQAQLSVLNDNINIRVSKGDVINQINISDENILIQANKIMALGDVVVDGKLTITDEFIAPNAQIDGAKIADATINSAKINDLDASKITTGTLTGIDIIGNRIRNEYTRNISDGTITGTLTIEGDILSEYTLSNGQSGFMSTTPTAIESYIYGTDKKTVVSSWSLHSSGFELYQQGNTLSLDSQGLYLSNGAFLERLSPTSDGMEWSAPGYLHLNAWGKRTISLYSDSIMMFRELALNNYAINTVKHIEFGNTAQYRNRIFAEPTDLGRWKFSGDRIIEFMTGGNLKFRVGQNQSNFYTSLSMEGNNITNQSDRRLKFNIEETSVNSLEEIKSMYFVEFDRTNGNHDDIGVIAQDTPSLAIYDSERDIWSINSSKQIMMNSHAIQQLAHREENTNLLASENRTLIEELQEENEKLKSRIEELESAA